MTGPSLSSPHHAARTIAVISYLCLPLWVCSNILPGPEAGLRASPLLATCLAVFCISFFVSSRGEQKDHALLQILAFSLYPPKKSESRPKRENNMTSSGYVPSDALSGHWTGDGRS